MISTEHLRAEPYIYRTVPYISSNRTESPYPARKINRTVPYRGYVRLALDSIEREPNRIGWEMYGTVRFGTDSPLCERIVCIYSITLMVAPLHSIAKGLYFSTFRSI